MISLYPLRFEPLYKHYLWGGRRFETLLGRRLTPGEVYAESWEIVDHGEDQSVVHFGPLAGRTLRELMNEHRDALLGPAVRREAPGVLAGRFPLLLKLLDAAQNLSIQVHPDDAMAARLDPPELGKTEAWYVLAAEPGSRIWAGLKPGVDRPTLARAVRDGTCDDCVDWFEPRPGDALLIRAGTVHSLGAGVMVAEIQQASDATFRLFDWNRLGPDGRPRPLHVEQALEAIDFDAGPVRPVPPIAGDVDRAVPILDCEYFALARWELTEQVSPAGDGRCHLLCVLEGSVTVEGD
ncbi:MAG TPA: type I phosphomannose isomerase catalytic subunit, partial [Thermoguttaceae bacterium]|nr:type I phosphomannose isomerase catalytic subunit [Thermoguttaceae bacterium]